MNKKLLFTFPIAISCLALFSCGGEKVTKITATVPSTNVYKRDGTISKDDITVTADTNNGSKKIASKDWTSDKFGSNTTYTFTASGENTIDIKYGGQSCDVKVSVNPKGSTEFTFKDGDSIKLAPEETKTVEIKMNETGAEVDIAKVDWSISELSTEKDAIKITPDTTNKFKCTVEGLKAGEAVVNALATDTVGNSKQKSLNVEVTASTGLAITVEQTGDSLTYLNPSDYPQSIEKTATTFTLTIKQSPAAEGSVNVLVLDTGSSKQYSNDFYPGGSLTYELDECNFSKWTGITIRAVYNEE